MQFWKEAKSAVEWIWSMLAAPAKSGRPSMRSHPVDEWLSSYFAPEQQNGRVDKHGRYRYHTDHLKELESVFIALRRDIPDGGLIALSKMTHIRDATFHQWLSNMQTNPLSPP
jgi:hypothetical protein